MLAIHFTRTELELLVKSVEVAGMSGWPAGDDGIRVQVLRDKLEKNIATLKADTWGGPKGVYHLSREPNLIISYLESGFDLIVSYLTKCGEIGWEKVAKLSL